MKRRFPRRKLSKSTMALSKEKRGLIIGMMLGGRHTKVQIAREADCHVKTVTRLWDRYNAGGRQAIPMPRPIPGRPERATLGHIKRIKKIIKKHPFWSARAIRDAHPDLEELPVYIVQRVLLRKLKLKADRAAKKPPPSDRMLADRQR